MKSSLLTLLGVLLFATLSYSQFDQEEQTEHKESKTVEEFFDKAVDKVEELSESIDLKEFFERDLPEFIEDITPTREEIANFEERVHEKIECLKDFDASVIDEVLEDIEEGTEEILKDIEDEIDDYKKTKRKSSKI